MKVAQNWLSRDEEIFQKNLQKFATEIDHTKKTAEKLDQNCFEISIPFASAACLKLICDN